VAMGSHRETTRPCDPSGPTRRRVAPESTSPATATRATGPTNPPPASCTATAVGDRDGGLELIGASRCAPEACEVTRDGSLCPDRWGRDGEAHIGLVGADLHRAVWSQLGVGGAKSATGTCRPRLIGSAS
jgi:hypothetical protein